MIIKYTNRNSEPMFVGSEKSIGHDLPLLEDIEVHKGKGVVKVSTGISWQPCPRGEDKNMRVFGMVIARSSLHKHGLYLPMGAGIIDEDYRGEIQLVFAVLDYFPEDVVRVAKGTRLCQLIPICTPTVIFKKVDILDETQRGDGGFGSTD